MPASGPSEPAERGGFAASLVVAMLDEGVNLDDRHAVADWMADFNRRERHERDAILGGRPAHHDFDDIDDPNERAVKIALPTEEAARASAATSPLLAQVRELVAFIGDGRKATQTGAVTLADARTLVALLDTGDSVDAAVGDKVYKTRSIADLPNLSFVVRIATGARFIRVVKGKLVSTKAGKSLGRHPLEDLARLIAGIDDVGVASARLAGNRWVWGPIAPYFDDMFGELCLALLSADSGVPFSGVVAAAFEQFQDEIDVDNPYWTEEFRRNVVEQEMRTAIETLEAAGTVVWSGVTSSDTGSRRTEETVSTTPAGQWALSRHLSEHHGVPFAAAEPVRFSSLAFEALIGACEEADLDGGDVMRELAAWVAHRGDDALGELIETVRTTNDPAVRQIALAAIGEQFGDRAESAVRALLDDSRLRAPALLWLVHQGAEGPDVLVDPDPEVFSEIVGLAFVTDGPPALLDLFERVGNHDEQIAAINRLWRVTTPTAGPVLAALGRLHPVKAVAKAARKASLQHASFVANQRK